MTPKDGNYAGRVPHMQDNPIRKARWAYMTAGLSDQKRIVCEVLLDNQKELYERKASLGPLWEDVVTTTNVGAFTTFSYPLVRRVFPRLIANDLVSVQPMSQPTGKIFYFDINYSATGSPPVAQRVDLTDNFQDSYAQAAEAAQVPQLSLSIENVDVTSETKKLSAKWSMESEQDLFAYHGISAENELMTAIGDEITREIDRSIINDLFSFAGAGNVNWSSATPTSGGYANVSPKDYAETLFDAIVDANNLIRVKRYRNATWLVVGTRTAARMEKLNKFRLFPAGDPTGTVVQGPNLFGTLSARWNVYVDPWLDATLPGGEEKILLGYKGASALDTGYIYAPYIPLITTQPFTNPDTLTTVRAMMTRYAKKGVIPENYATVTIQS
jgi:hypothetical protein